MLDNHSPPKGCGPLLPLGSAQTKSMRQQIFEHVRAAGRATRTDVIQALGISAGSATALTAEMINAGLLREVESIPRETGRGRPAVALEVVPETHAVIGIKLSEKIHSAVLTDFAGNTRATAVLETPAGPKQLDDVLAEVGKLIQDVLNAADTQLSAVAAVGIGLSGIVDHQAGTVPWSPLLAQRNCDFATAFREKFDLPIHLDNDANMLTLAELWFGAGRAKSDFAVVTIEQGVGMGLVIDNRLYRGARGMGLELGHTKVQLDGALCRCGRRGCLEAYLADYALAREAATALHLQPHESQSPNALLAALFAQAKSGDEAAQTIFRRAGRYLAVGLANIVQLFDPALIIISGERMQYDYLYAEEVLSEMHRLTLNDGRTPCAVETHAWGDLVWARGATALALSAVTDQAIAQLT
ncbi:XylR family transcriptional regulator [Loktanella sp. D2R18]|uniref:ROK family protein n=1 Tax=Rhodobacterales TaxID=204455 RepID=UPI000DE85429|nr:MULTISPECIES: ROK family protein [Rhodobacterales]MDO6591819.1 ROK family protein [Yoonia sp. 1_MG-2023]RBW44880.1 XylR family transcriptional regulator [Loktanella sp. D2R18]